MATYKFPNGFKWGSATSAHQVEGNNRNDWTEWEQSEERVKSLKFKGLNPTDFISGKACDSYNRYEEDFDIAKKLNQNIHRFSIEWSRIEPEEGKFDFEAIKHYQRLVKTLRDRGMEPMVTLWHFTNPIWFAKKGGWLNSKAPEYFTRYVKCVVDNLKDEVGLWITFNEATTVYCSLAYLKGEWPPSIKNFFKFNKARKNFVRAHTLSYQEIKRIYNQTSHNVAVGVTENNVCFTTHKLFGKLGIVNFLKKLGNLYFWNRILPYHDFLGLNYYRNVRLPGNNEPVKGFAKEMGWEIYPRGIYHELMNLKRYKKPIYITENGIADSKDEQREKFIKEHLRWVWQAIHDGVDVRGYMYWSLLDNFEWAHGFGPRFGLVEIDYATLERKIRLSAYEYAKICMTNQLETDL